MEISRFVFFGAKIQIGKLEIVKILFIQKIMTKKLIMQYQI